MRRGDANNKCFHCNKASSSRDTVWISLRESTRHLTTTKHNTTFHKECFDIVAGDNFRKDNSKKFPLLQCPGCGIVDSGENSEVYVTVHYPGKSIDSGEYDTIMFHFYCFCGIASEELAENLISGYYSWVNI